jgi:hypothetical protein
MNFIHSASQVIAKIIIAPIIFLMGLAGYPTIVQDDIAPKTAITLGDFNPTGGGTYRLQTSAGSTDTSIRLSSFKEPVSNIPYTMAYMNTSIAYGTLDPQQPTRREFISFTGITQNSDGTAILTGVTRGLSGSYPYTASSTLRQAHSGQSIFILSDAPQLFTQYAVKANAQNIYGAWTFASTAPALYDAAFTVSTSSLQIPYASWIGNNFVNTSGTQTINGVKTFTNGFVSQASSTFTTTVNGIYDTASSSLATVGYANDLAFAGVANAAPGTKGIVEEATVAEINAGASIGGSGAKLIATPAALFQSVFASTTASTTVFVTNNISTTTGVTAGETLLIIGTGGLFSSNNNFGLFLKQTGHATTTLHTPINCVSGVNCALAFNATYMATTTTSLQIYVATDITSAPATVSQGFNISILRFTK